MSKFYFSGIEKRTTAEALVKTGAAGMMSRLRYTDSLLEACVDIPFVMDCGSFTAPLTRSDIEIYAALILKLGLRCDWYAAPDVIGDQAKSNENYTYLLSLLPEELHDRILWIYQYGANLSFLYEGLERHAKVGIGGLVPLIKSNDKDRAKQNILSLAQIVRQYGRVPHWFGLSVVSILEALNSLLDDYSVDSTTWLAGGRYGLLINSQGQQRPAREGGYDFDTESILKQNIRIMRKWVEQPVIKTSDSKYKQLSFMEGAA